MKQTKLTFTLFITSILMLFSFSQMQADNSNITGPKAIPGATQTYSIEIPSFAKFKRPYIHIYITGGVFANTNNSYKRIFTTSLDPQRIRVKWNNSCKILVNIPGQGASISAYPSALATISATNIGGGSHPDFPAGGATLFSNPANFGGGIESYCIQKRNQFNNLYASLDLCSTTQQEIDNLIKQVDPIGCCNIKIPTPSSSECLSIQNEAQAQILAILSDPSIPFGDKFPLIEEISACVGKQGCSM
ncbi:hypothetical protein [Aquimarina agarilytica]|uniref:hypothetical protein n=1 Tax=Aquimarina agarilytica TaxID=1087449 RepID=UPI00028A0854|nr:hypothetical protein [Aquimarina agarilytica]